MEHFSPSSPDFTISPQFGDRWGGIQTRRLSHGFVFFCCKDVICNMNIMNIIKVPTSYFLLRNFNINISLNTIYHNISLYIYYICADVFYPNGDVPFVSVYSLLWNIYQNPSLRWLAWLCRFHMSPPDPVKPKLFHRKRETPGSHFGRCAV